MKNVDLLHIQSYLGVSFCKELPEKYRNLYERYSYVLTKFLNDSDNNILFLQIPVEQYSIHEKEFIKDWTDTCNTIALTLRLILKRQAYRPEDLDYPGDWYNNNDCFILLPNEEDKEQFYFLKCDNGSLRFKWEKKLNRKEPSFKTQAKAQIINSARALYRIHEVPTQINSGFKKCSEEIRLLDIPFEHQGAFNTASIISSKPLVYKNSGQYILPTIEVHNSNCQTPISDIVVVIGDVAFNRLHDLINKLQPYGPIKKIVAIGANPTRELIEQKPEHISVAFKKIHKYCISKRFAYAEPVFLDIEFPWLCETLSNLKSILDKHQKSESLYETDAIHIFNYARKVFSDIDFSSDILERFKANFCKFLNAILEEDDSDNIMEDLDTWSKGIIYTDESNPKKSFINERVLFLNPDRSIKQQLKGYYNDSCTIIIDAPIHYSHYTLGGNKTDTIENTLTAVKRYNNIAPIYALYYKGVEDKLMAFSEYNMKHDYLYSDPSIIDNPINDETGIKEFNIEEYVDYPDELLSFDPRNSIVPTVEFSDGTKELMSGDVLLCSEDGQYVIININDLDEIDGRTILYYLQPNNPEIFNALVNASLHFPNGKDINYYSNLWHSALQQLDADGLKQLNDIGISNAVINNHLYGSSKFMNKHAMRSVLSVLVSKSLITEQESKDVKNARKIMKGNNTQFGGKLKKWLFDYLLSQSNVIDKRLEELLNKANLSIDDLLSSFIQIKTVKKISYDRTSNKRCN